MARATDDSGTIQTAFRLPQSLYDRIAAASGERGISYEIRRRLEASFAGEIVASDPRTMQLGEAIIAAADEVAELNGGRQWHSDAYSFIAFKTALEKLLARELKQPAGKALADPAGIWGSTSSGEATGLGYAVVSSVIADLNRRGKKK
jgi:hypothetical protein